MAAGLSGHHGPSVHQCAVLASRQGNGSVIHPLRNTGAAAALGRTYRLETVTPIPAQVLCLSVFTLHGALIQNIVTLTF